MNRLQLASLIDQVETTDAPLEGRKRLQKLVYLLQFGGHDLGVDYTLHHYGPYARGLASLTDEMVDDGLLQENREPFSTGYGGTYTYRLTDGCREQLRTLARSGQKPLDDAKALLGRLAKEDVWPLELSSTVAYFVDSGCDWPEAVRKAAEFKKQDADGEAMKAAEGLAREVRSLGGGLTA